MRFLVDAQLPPALSRWIGERGHEAVHVHDIGMTAASDIAIAALAERDGFMLVSKDDDFIVLRLPDRFAFLWLRCGNATNRALVAWIAARWDDVERLLANASSRCADPARDDVAPSAWRCALPSPTSMPAAMMSVGRVSERERQHQLQ